ncbi:alpha/beta hydrolase [Myxococcota bacterium]|nr:alpha/beta hydrolase [Myxococcota bacterium]
MWWLLLACAPQGPGTLLLAPDPDRSGLAGAQGPHGAAWVRASTAARVEERLRLEVVFPADAQGWLAEEGPFPAVALVQGGLVDVEQYRWLSAWLASRGYLVVAALHDHRLALLAADDSAIALSAVERWSAREGLLSGAADPDAPAAILGHSLGGATAAVEWVQDERFLAMGLLASFPADFTPVEEVDRPALSLYGSTDEVVDPSLVVDGFARLAGPALLGEVQGLNHHGWFDDPRARDVERDGPLEGDLDTLRGQAMAVVDTFLDAWLREDPQALLAFEQGDFEGVEERR